MRLRINPPAHNNFRARRPKGGSADVLFISSPQCSVDLGSTCAHMVFRFSFKSNTFCSFLKVSEYRAHLCVLIWLGNAQYLVLLKPTGQRRATSSSAANPYQPPLHCTHM